MLWLLGSFLSFLFQCRPIDAAFIPQRMGSCFNVESWLLSTATSNMIIDWLILLLPILPLYRIRSRLEGVEEALIYASFGMGFIACVASSTHAVLNHAVLDDNFNGRGPPISTNVLG